MTSIKVTRTPNAAKSFKAVFTFPDKRTRTVRFGTESNYVLTDKTPQDRRAYRARHRVRENWRDPLSAGALSRYILWGESRDWRENLRDFRKRFKLS